MATDAMQKHSQYVRETFGKAGLGAGPLEAATNKDNRSAVKQVLTRKRLLSRSMALREAGQGPSVISRRFLVHLEKALCPVKVRLALKRTREEGCLFLSPKTSHPPDNPSP